MLKKNLDSERGSEDGKRADRFWTKPLRTLISSLTFVALFPFDLAAQATAAQATAPTALATPQAAVYGSGIQAPLQFEGESVPVNQVSFSMGTSALYDDNVLGTNSHRLGDEELSFDSRLRITRQTEHLTASFDYTPFFVLYRKIDQYDRANHSAKLSLAYRLTSRVILGLHDTFSYQNGIYPSLTEQQIMSGLASPTALNQIIVPYTTRVLTNMAGLNLTFAKSHRTSLTLSGDYNQLKYGSRVAGQPLYNGNGLSGGLQFQYGVTEHTSFGIFLLHEDTTYQGGRVFGSRVRAQIESAFLSMGSRLSPTLTVTVFGGPQYVRTIDQISPGISLAGHFQGSGGGSITKEVRKTALNLSFQRSVSYGAGLYVSAIDTSATFGVRRRLVGRWEVDWHGGAARLDPSLFQFANGRTDALSGGIDLIRPFSHASVFHISYNTMHQLSRGTLPISADFDRNQVAVGIDYQFKAFPIGR